MQLPPVKRPRPDQRMCPHCNQIVSYKTYRAHKRLYYNSETNAWFQVVEDSDEPSEEGELHMNEGDSPPSSPTDYDCGQLQDDMY